MVPPGTDIRGLLNAAGGQRLRRSTRSALRWATGPFRGHSRPMKHPRAEMGSAWTIGLTVRWHRAAYARSRSGSTGSRGRLLFGPGILLAPFLCSRHALSRPFCSASYGCSLDSPPQTGAVLQTRCAGLSASVVTSPLDVAVEGSARARQPVVPRQCRRLRPRGSKMNLHRHSAGRKRPRPAASATPSW